MKALKTIPKEISYDDSQLKITWKDEHESTWALLKLRKNCPCATCRGGDFGEIGTKTKHIQSAHIVSYTTVGRYALCFTWNDNHNTGIYTYQNLKESCECSKCKK